MKTFFYLFFPLSLIFCSNPIAAHAQENNQNTFNLSQAYLNTFEGIDSGLSLINRNHHLEPERKLFFLDQLFRASQKLKYPAGQAGSLLQQGVVFRNKDSLARAEALLKQALAVVTGTKNRLLLYQVFKELVNNELASGQLKDAEKNINNALGCLEDKVPDGISREYDRADLYDKLGIVNVKMGNFEQAASLFLKALEMATRVNDTTLLFNAYLHVGNTYHELNNVQLALKYHYSALHLGSILGEKQYAKVVMNIGNAWHYANNPDSATYYYKKALTLFHKQGNRIYEAYAKVNLANAANQQKRPNEALQYLGNDLYNFFLEIEDFYFLPYAYKETARAHRLLGNYSKALEFLNKAEAVYQKYEHKLRLEDVYEEYILCYQQLGDINKMAHYYSLQRKLNEELFKERLDQKIARLEVLHETERKEQQIQKMALNNKLQETRKNAYAVGLVLSLLIGACGTAFLLIRIKYHKTQRKLIVTELSLQENELRHKKEQLDALVNHFLDKVNIVEKIQEDIQGQKEPVNEESESRQRILKIEQLLNFTVLTENDWLQFKQTFAQVYPGFFAGLKDKYPALTEAETRLLAITKLNLSTRETANMLGISESSVKNARNRLRRKLDLPSEYDLFKLI